MWKRLQTPLKAVVIVVIVALAAWQAFPLQKKIHLGLDLQGGVRVLLQLTPTKEVPTITSDVLGVVEQVVQTRVNTLGVAEPVISQSGSDRLLVELPAVKNPQEVERLLKEAAVLDFKIVPPAVNARALADKKYADDPNGAYKDSGAVIYSGADLKGAQAAVGPGGQPQINFQTKNPSKFGKLTADNIGKNLGIFLDKKYVSAPTIDGVITSDGDITGQFTEDDTIRISNELNAGALPVPVTIIENDAVGPILGAIDLQKSLVASMVGLGLVLLFMVFVYRLPGFLADVALVIYVLLMLGLLAFSGAVLTLPGIAGFVLSIGMAVDANVLIFERLKEELWAGKSLRQSVRIGFARAFSSVFDSHFTTIVGAGALFVLGTGTVKGFAYTLFWGTVFSLITAVFVTRTFTDAVVDNDLVTAPAAYGA
jgi:preprotein translocase subunit SecD